MKRDMRKAARWSAVALPGLLAMLALACIPSINPVYTEKDLIFEESLLGEWTQDESKWTWRFEADGEAGYSLLHTVENGTTATFEAKLALIQGQAYLDLHPDLDTLPDQGFWRGHMMPVHTFYQVDLGTDTLKLTFLNPEWLKKRLEERPDAIEHVWKEDVPVLIAPTERLQSFLTFDCNNPEAFKDAFELRRTSAPAATTK